MKIGLIDVDSHNFPNLALMKISAYHKSKGDHVEWINPLLGEYDIVYQSKIFDFTPDFNTCIKADKIIKGGTAYGLDNKLPDEIENMYPDYELYGIKDVAYGFLTRGCPRKCDFCIVSKKEGNKSIKVADLKQFWNSQREIKLLDPNLLACKDRLELLDQLIESKAWIDFTQGLDIRLMTDEVIDKIKQIKIKMIHFAWDREKDSDIIIKNLINFKKKTGIEMRKTRVYVLTNFDTDFEFDLYRIYKLKELNYDPYVMIYNKQNAHKKYKRLQRWVNNKFIFRSCERFEDYKP
ncbi:MAG: radical SAM protein [Thermosipho sp. (in: Bacteria)]|nr:radical SAM protein [Thermosipho sp. (in: thermotogales)]